MPTTLGRASDFITFSRPGATGGGATVTDRDGKIKWAGHNLLSNSESFDASGWGKVTATVGANAGVSPLGTTNADKFIPDNAATGTLQVTASKTADAIRYTHAVFAKADGITSLTLSDRDDAVSGNNASVTVSLTDGSITAVAAAAGTFSNATAVVTSIGSGWYLIALSFTSGTETAIRFRFLSGTTGNGTNGILLWGAHLYRSDLGGMQQNPAMGAGMGSYYPTTPRNLLGYTEDFNTGWTKSNVTVSTNAVNAPNGLLLADKVVATLGATSAHVNQQISVALIPYSFSVYAKAAEYTQIQLADDGVGKTAFFNLATGTVGVTSGVTASITSVGDGWYRCAVILTNILAGPYRWRIYLAQNGSTTISGDGTSGVYLWGAQLSDSASLDTYVPQYGAAVTSAAYYAPRLDFDPVTLAARGLLVEEQRTNVLLYSQDFTQSFWVKTVGGTGTTPVVTGAYAVSPDGTNTATRVQFNASGTTSTDRSILRSTAQAIATGNQTASIWIKSNTGASQTVNLSIGGAALISCVATTEWQRFSTTQPAGGTPATVQIDTRTAETADVLIWGAQHEAGSFATSYIPTGSATATRAADVASVSTQAFPYSGTASSLVISVQPVSTATGGDVSLVTDASNTAGWLFGGGTIYSRIRSSGTVTQTTSYTLGAGVQKAGLAYEANNANATKDGVNSADDTTVTVPTVNTLSLGVGSAGSGVLNGWIRQVTYLPRRISNADLQARTSN